MPNRRAGLEVDGLRETVRALERAGTSVDDLKEVMNRIAAKAADVMRPLIPSRSGKLRGTARPNRAKNNARVTVGTARVKYAPIANYGWPKRNIRAADFIAQTDRAMEDIAPRMLEDGLTDLLEKEGLT